MKNFRLFIASLAALLLLNVLSFSASAAELLDTKPRIAVEGQRLV